MRNVTIHPGEYYHIFNRGNHRQDIFYDDGDYVRFLIALLSCQFSGPVVQFARVVHKYVQHSVLDTTMLQRGDRSAELVCFALMPNHFHALIRERMDGGIARYMQRLLNGYTKYVNTKHGKSGHLFQGAYHAVHVEDDDQLCYLSAYIHRNPCDLPGWEGKEHRYPWSSYQDYLGTNRWGALLVPSMILDQVGRSAHYQQFVERTHVQHSVLDSGVV